MADEAHERTDEILKRLERNVKKEYSIAVRDMSAKLQEYLEKDEIKRLEQEKLLKAGKITKKEYQDWCFRHQMMGKRWEDMLNVLSEDMHHTNEIALSMAKDKMPDIYALNMNYGTYEIEHGGRIDTGFTLYNHDTAEYLLGDQRQLMPKPSPQRAKQIAANKDLQWNKKKIQSAVLQGVLQGENPYQVARRLRSVGQMNYNSSVRYARTMGTSAQNAGRYESYRRAKRLGVDLTIEWSATLDGRTRHDHRLMHGQRTEVDEPFHTPDGFTIYYPADCTGDSDAPQQEIWNCRCTLLAWVKGFEGDIVKSSPKMGNMTFEEWQGKKAAEEVSRPENEQEILKQFNFTGKKSLEDILKQTNPHFEDGEEWQRNCQRTVVAEELCYRGYNVTAKPRSASDPIGSSGTACWEFDNKVWWRDSQFKTVDKRSNFGDIVDGAFNEWGAGSRGIIRLQWDTKHGGGGHFIFAAYDGKIIKYSDPQSGEILNILEELKDCSRGRNKMWVMRVDNREVSDLVTYAVENYK